MKLALAGEDRVAVTTPDILLRTKLFRPCPRSDLVQRPRLAERLAAGLRGPLTLIVAPAGWGKTTLLTEWPAARPEGARSMAWLALDAGDNDLARFLRYVIAALQSLRADIGLSVLAGLRSLKPPVDALLTLLLNELASLPDDIVLVLDDYHVIETATIHEAVAFLLNHLPPQVHLIIASRVDLPAPLARLRAGGGVTELGPDDLRFTIDEAAAFLHQTMGLPLAADAVARLEASTEGWIAGLQLAALSLQGRDPAQLSGLTAASTGANRYILDYLADEVYDRQPDDVRRFLLHTSILERMCGGLCDAVTATPDATSRDGQAMLERLDRANMFVVPLDDNGTWFRYHHLFAGFLRQRLRRERADLAPDLHRRACSWYEQQGLTAEAADHAFAAGDHEAAARLVERALPAILWQRGELATLLRWLEQLPRAAAHGRPRLCLDLAWVLLWSARLDAVEPRLQDAEHALETAASSLELRASARSRALRGEIAAIRAELARLRGDLAAAIDLGRRALDYLPADDRRVRGVTNGLLAGAYLWSGNVVAAGQAYGEAVMLSRTPSTITLALIASGRLVMTQALQGRLRQAAATYQQTLGLAAGEGMTSMPAIGVAQVGMGEVLREWNDLAAAEALLQEGVERCASSGGQAEMALDGCLTLALVLQAQGNTAGALAALQRAEALGRDGQVVQYAERVALARARQSLAATPTDLSVARLWASMRAAAWRVDEHSGYVGLLERLTQARLQLLLGRREEAFAWLRRLLEIAEAGGLTGCVIEILALQARMYLEEARVAQAMIVLTHALALAEPEGYVRTFVDEGAPMVALLRQARARGVAPAYVASLLTACGDALRATSPAAAALVEPLSARELELLRLLAAGLSTSELAAQLVITDGTVRNHLKNIYGKLDVHSRLQAVERARALRLL